MEGELTTKAMEDLSKKVDRIHSALIGDELGNDGLVERVKFLEEEAEKNKMFRERIYISYGIMMMIATGIAYISNWILEFFKKK